MDFEGMDLKLLTRTMLQRFVTMSPTARHPFGAALDSEEDWV
jgi:DNA-binding transcriptional MocR family regulator